MLGGIESPTHLLSKGKPAKAKAAARALWGNSYQNELYSATDSVVNASSAHCPKLCLCHVITAA